MLDYITALKERLSALEQDQIDRLVKAGPADHDLIKGHTLGLKAARAAVDTVATKFLIEDNEDPRASTAGSIAKARHRGEKARGRAA